MRIAITGATGLIGTQLTAKLTTDGHDVVTIGRSASGPNGVRWDPETGTIETSKLDGVDGVVHLAGEPIGAKRWTDDQKRRIVESREKGTRLIAETLASLAEPPKRFISGSAIGFYGDCGAELLTEESPNGDTFLAEVVRRWESAAAPAVDAGISTTFARTGIVLSTKGGALKQQLLPFKLGIGGKSGSGRQYQSWVHIDDEVGALAWLLDHDITGPVNIASPNPVQNSEFASTLASVLRRPSTMIPMIGPRLLFGRELADTLLLESQRVHPTRLVDGAYEFRFTDLRAALTDLVG